MDDAAGRRPPDPAVAMEDATLNSKSIAHTAAIQASVYALVVLLVLLVIETFDLLLMLFGGVLLAILLHGISHWLHRKTGINEKLALALAITLPLILLVVGTWFAAPNIAEQAGELSDRLPRAFEQLRRQLLQHAWLDRIWESTNRLRALVPDDSSAAQYLGKFFSSTLGAFGNVLFVLFVGLFLSLNPALYIDGLLQLVPPARQARAREVLRATAATLRNWLIAKLASMLLIGVLTTAGLMVLGVDLALILGVIAAVLSFIPNFGPIASAVPAALIALAISPEKALHVLALYAAIQTVESYGLTPFLQQRLVRMPPALLLTMQVVFGVLAGIAGVLFATPLTAAAMVMVKMWYVEDILHQRNETTP
jgi:predicted PurR-regulated permease PerM